jgi:hypothetical protein
MKFSARPEFPGYDVCAGYAPGAGSYYVAVFDRSDPNAARTVVNLGADATAPIWNPNDVTEAIAPYVDLTGIRAVIEAELCEQAYRAGDRFTENGDLCCRHCGVLIGVRPHGFVTPWPSRERCPRIPKDLPIELPLC